MIIQADKSNLGEIMKIIKTTVTEMKSYDNVQWDENYPQEKDFQGDIQKGDLYIIKTDEVIKGFICLNYIEPLEYKGLNWSSAEKGLVIHRMAVNPNYRNQGIAAMLMKFAEELALKKGVNYLKTDTYSINKKMNAFFVKYGYKFIGEINFPGKKEPFYCYDKLLKNQDGNF